MITGFVLSTAKETTASLVSSIFSLTLVLGGAVGNLIDRIFRGYVVDFLSFRLFNYDMPVFNVADIFITCGVILVIFCILREGKYEKNSSRRRK